MALVGSGCLWLWLAVIEGYFQGGRVAMTVPFNVPDDATVALAATSSSARGGVWRATAEVYPVRDIWTTREAVRKLAREHPELMGRMSNDRLLVASHAAELHSLQGEASACPTLLDELMDCVKNLETQRREERARLEAEVAALSDALHAKREACERLRRRAG